MQPHTLLIASAQHDQHAFLMAPLDGDGHTVHDTDNAPGTIAKLSAYAVDVLLLGELQAPADSPALLREIRAETHTRIHPAQPVITLGNGDELTALRAYEAGSDHHLPDSTGYVLLRSVIATITRRTLEQITGRHIHVGALHTTPPPKPLTSTPSPCTSPAANTKCSSRWPPTPPASSHAANSSTPSGAPRTSAPARSKRTSPAYATASPPPAAPNTSENAWGQGWALTSRHNAAA